MREYLRWYSEFTNNTFRGSKRDFEDVPDKIRVLVDVPPDSMVTFSDVAWQVFREMMIENGAKMVPGFVVDKHNEHIINCLAMWLAHDEALKTIEPEYRFSRGFMLRGSIGSGKTILAKIFKKTIDEFSFFCLHNEHGYCFRELVKSHPDSDRKLKTFEIKSSNEIAEAYSRDSFEIFYDNYEGKTHLKHLATIPLLIDDIGSEPIYSHYGNSANIIAELLIRRYDRGRLTFATSNLTVSDLEKLYGPRVFDRMREMFNDITLQGESRRK